jgi:predicted AlkP superfamily pyrophosphatase or phosphodiesterase
MRRCFDTTSSRGLGILLLTSLVSALPACSSSPATQPHKVILFVWDGLRPDVITQQDTPNLLALAARGTRFLDNHSTYPTFTMVNAGSFATGGFTGTTGFYGNEIWAAGANGNDSTGKPVDFSQPVFTEDYGILQDLDAHYGNQLFLVGTLFDAAQKAGLKTFALGKSGAAFIQDYKKGGQILDEKMAYPMTFATALQGAGMPLPSLTPMAYPTGQITLTTSNGNPTSFGSKKFLGDGVTTDPTDASGSPYDMSNAYLLGVYTAYVIPKDMPDLSMIWFRNPDSTQHAYGVGVANFHDALRAQDALLGQLEASLMQNGQADTTNIIVVSDHAHSNVAGPPSLFPLRAISSGAVGAADPNGYSVSGDVRIADLLTRAGFAAYDGVGCANDPVLSGVKADGSAVYAQQTDTAGTICGKAGAKYVTPSYKVPATLPSGAIVIASNGGSEYLYMPDHSATEVASVVTFLQSREEVGPLFIDARYGALPGTLSMDMVKLENSAGRNPDIILSYNFDATAMVQGFPGTEFESAQNNRGMHGTFSPIDVHNVLIAAGPDFKSGLQDSLPSGNVDVAPTIAQILGVSLPGADGRALLEALNTNGAAMSDYAVTPASLAPAAPATGLVMKLPTSPDGTDVDSSATTYTFQVATKTVAYKGKSYTYFDSATATRN